MLFMGRRTKNTMLQAPEEVTSCDANMWEGVMIFTLWCDSNPFSCHLQTHRGEGSGSSLDFQDSLNHHEDAIVRRCHCFSLGWISAWYKLDLWCGHSCYCSL